MKTLLLLSCLCLEPPLDTEQPLTNAAILELVRNGFPDQTVMQLIDGRDSAFDVSVPGLVALKKSGASDVLIRAMLAASARDAGGALRGRPPASIPDEQGVYWEGEQVIRRLPVENVTLRGPHGDTGAIQGTRSSLMLTPPLTFLVRAPENITADEYLLVQLFIRNDRREFRTLMGGLWRGDGVEHMAVPFESERLAPNLYRLRVVALPKGEFGFLRPGTQLTVAAAVSRPESASGLPVRPVGGPQGLPAQRGSVPSAGPIFTFGVQ